MSTVHELTLPALNAQNPLGLFAALGLLRLLDGHARRHTQPAPKLAFTETDFTARLRTTLHLEQIFEAILDAAQRQSGHFVLQLAYDKTGASVSAEHPSARRDLKASAATTAKVLEEARKTERSYADFASAFFSEVVQDNNGNTKPTSFHFTAGQQAFLGMIEDLRTGLTLDALKEAFFGPWLNTSKLPSMSWDSSVSRLYALRATDPSTDKRGSVPGANWLAVQALPCFPVYPKITPGRVQLVTTCVLGGWKTSQFTWPVWNGFADEATTRALLRCKPDTWRASERKALGLIAVLRSSISRSDQGGYGTFLPAEVLAPAR